MTNLETIKEIANKITELRQRDFNNTLIPYGELLECLAEDETYEVDIHNVIVGCNISIADCQFIIRRTVEKDIVEIYADNQETGENGSINVDSHGNMANVINFLKEQNINIQFYGVSLNAIGQFYKPNNQSKLNLLNNTDKETLIYLLEFLQKKKILTLIEDLHEVSVYDRLADVLVEWNSIKI